MLVLAGENALRVAFLRMAKGFLINLHGENFLVFNPALHGHCFQKVGQALLRLDLIPDVINGEDQPGFFEIFVLDLRFFEAW